MAKTTLDISPDHIHSESLAKIMLIEALHYNIFSIWQSWKLLRKNIKK